MTDCDVLSMIPEAQEFEQLKFRDDDLTEFDSLVQDYCEVEVKDGSENLHGRLICPGED